MRTLAVIFGMLLIAIGALSMFAGCSLTRDGSTAMFYLVLGGIMIVGGWLVCRASGRKRCPSCAESVREEALRCKHCGHEFPPKTAGQME